MSKEHQNLRDSLCELIRSLFTPTKYGTVTAVDQVKRTCSVQIGGIVREGVLLHAVIDDSKKGFCFIPKLESKVLLSTFNDTRSYVTMFSEVDKVLLTIGEKVEMSVDDKTLHCKNDKTELTIIGNKVELTADGIEFNGGKNNGLVKVKELTEKINKLEKQSDDILAALLKTTIALAPSGSFSIAPFFTMSPLGTTPQSAIENPDIKH